MTQKHDGIKLRNNYRGNYRVPYLYIYLFIGNERAFIDNGQTLGTRTKLFSCNALKFVTLNCRLLFMA